MTYVETGWASGVTLHDDGRVSLTRASLHPTPTFLHIELTAREVAAIRRTTPQPADTPPEGGLAAQPLSGRGRLAFPTRRATCPVCGVEGVLVNYSNGGLRVHCPGARTSRSCVQTCRGSGKRPT